MLTRSNCESNPMEDDFERPPGIGPHNDRELELMLAGTKPMAMFSDAVHASSYFPETDFAPYVAAGKIIRIEEIIPARPYDARHLFFALPGEEWRIEEALIMCRNLWAGTVKDHDEDSARMGELLGYSMEDIEAFLAHTKAQQDMQNRLEYTDAVDGIRTGLTQISDQKDADADSFFDRAANRPG